MDVVEVAVDLCDACPSEAHVQAYVFVKMPTGHTLSFCGSHGARFMPALYEQGATIADLRHMIH